MIMHLSNIFEFKKTDNLEKDKNMIFTEISEWGSYESDSRNYHGNLTFKTDKIFETRDDAESFLLKFRGDYKDVAVIYKDRDEKAITSSKIKKMEEKRKKIIEDWKEYERKNWLSNRKSKTVACPKCKSVLNIEYMTRSVESKHHCPICGEELLSKTVTDRIKKYNSDLIELDKKIATETRNIAIKTKKFELRWLVKAEVHC